ncbi:MAG: sigma-54 dependent transcriptional regulator, partial [Candidatus Zixiibacteriota bacterium]
MTPPNETRILILDDEQSIRRSLALVLTKEQYSIHEADTTAEAVKILRTGDIDLVLCDLRIGDENGIEFLRTVRTGFPEVEAILLTAFGSIESAVEAVRAGAFDYLTKPVNSQQLILKVQKALEHRFMRRELTNLRQHVALSYGFDNIVGVSKAITKVKETAARIAPTDITVLLAGASGTGKELLARAIHYHSNRRHSRFAAIDCSAIPETLMESELFGHMKGSYTSAFETRKGILEEADGGTVFLDEVNNMPLTMQSKLLRFLQDFEIRPVGSASSKKVDVRIIAATNKDLGMMVAEGTFRDDLFYRLNVIPIRIPTMAERAEDVGPLTDYFLRKIASDMKRPAIAVSQYAIEKLMGHSWPGNVRELENTLKRAVALSHNGQIDADQIIFAPARPMGSPATSITFVAPPAGGKSLAETQRSKIVQALDENSWNFTQTAQELGIGRTTLWRKIKKYNLEPVGSLP